MVKDAIIIDQWIGSKRRTYRSDRGFPPGGGILFSAEINPPGGEIRDSRGDTYFSHRNPVGESTPGGLLKIFRSWPTHRYRSGVLSEFSIGRRSENETA